MGTLSVSTFLRRVLLADAAVSAGVGFAMMAFAHELQAPLRVPSDLLFYAGFVLLPYAALVVWLVRRERIPRWTIWAVITGNALWALDSLVLPYTGWIDPTLLGEIFIVGQAIVTVAFAELEYIGLQKSEQAIA
jgi:hypothetical protein